MPLYRVAVTRRVEYVCIADDESAAKDLADEAWDAETVGLGVSEDYAVRRQPHSMALPRGWDDWCLVYHYGDGDITVREARAMDREASP